MIEYFKTQNMIENLVTQKIVPGVNYAFIKQGQVFTSTVGFSTWIPENVQLSPFAQYDLASLTKVLGTTNVLLKLVELNKINFDDQLIKYIPEFGDGRVKLSHLLTHSSGIKGYIPNRDQLGPEELLKAIINLPVTDEFERVVRYADTNFILLGKVIEEIYQQPVWDVITNEIIKSMGLSSTTFYPNKENSVPTILKPDGELLQGIVHDPKAQTLNRHIGSAGLFSDLNDLILIAKGYLGLDKDILPLSQETIADLFDVKTLPGLHKRSWGWDLKFDVEDDHPLLFHTGFTGTFMLLDKKMQSGMIVLTNRIHPTGHNQIFLTAREQIVQSFIKENR